MMNYPTDTLHDLTQILRDKPGSGMMAFGFAYLAAARQARLASRACPDQASTYRARAHFWLAMARREPPPRLP